MLRIAVGCVFLLAAAGCVISTDTGGPSDPVSSVPITNSPEGLAAVGAGFVDADTCAGVLGTAPSDQALEVRSLTSTVAVPGRDIDAMCSASFESSIPGDHFLTTTVILFSSDQAAIDRYEMIKDGFVIQNLPIYELNNASSDLIDQVGALINRDGMGRVATLRKKSWVVTVSAGPSTDAMPWLLGDLESIGR